MSFLIAQSNLDKIEVDKFINTKIAPISKFLSEIIFYSIPLGDNLKIPVVLVLLIATAIFMTLYFKFINIWSFKYAVKTVMGKYTTPDAKGQITHFQALSTALSATVGLGNISGVAIAIGLGGPGAVFWMILMGIFGMATKFCECTLGVKYRTIDKQGKVHGGAMYYISKGLKEMNLSTLGKILGSLFAITCIFGAIGGGCMYQANQSFSQFNDTFGIIESGWIYGLITAFIVGLVIIGGIKSIAKVAGFIVPIMCIVYVLTSLFIIILNIEKVPEAFYTIIVQAFKPMSFFSGGIAFVFIQGVKRAAFSNEAGIGSASIAHSAVKTSHPASEGLVAILEPFVDTVIVCTMTALVIIITGFWKVNAIVPDDAKSVKIYQSQNINSKVVTSLSANQLLTKVESNEENSWHKVRIVDTQTVNFSKKTKTGWVESKNIILKDKSGIWLTSKAFESSISWFPIILTISVILFAFSTMISWSYYGQQAIIYLFGNHNGLIKTYKITFCLFLIVGASASLSNIIDLCDAMFFAMVFPNLIGLFLLLPKVKQELKKYLDHIKKVESKY